MGGPPTSRPRRQLTGVLLAAALAAGAAACGGDEPAGLAGVVREPALAVAGIELPGPDGEPVAMRADDGELLVVYFGYTSCPDVCPTTMNDISIAVHELPDDLAERVSVAFVTVDPDRDSVEVLEGYLGHFFEEGGLAVRATDPDQLADAAAAFGVQFEVADHQAGDTAYDVAHTAVTYVVDDTGTVVVEWPFGFEDESMTADIRTLLNEETS